ncbi:MAG: hypothetical protein PHU63_03930 [Candidatus ainarchaeum sp.]|nr:hypothetical protein [Candidatus ainarchaeum sp.]
MYIPFFVKFFFFLLSASLIIFVILPDATLMLLIKMIALSTGISILVALLYPSFRGLKKGDMVIISNGAMPALFGIGRKGVAIEDGRMNNEIKIKLSDGREAVGIVEAYGGAFSMPRVRLLYEETIRE